MSDLTTISKKINNQDVKQKINSFCVVLVEIYKILASSLLILFVPQKCGDHMCSYQENIESDNNVYSGGLAINFFTLFLFLILYLVEIRRENYLITYLEVNIQKPFDNDSVGKSLTYLPETKKQKILSLDKIYQKIAKTSVFLFIANTILSGVIIYNYYLDDQTTTTFITNIFFMSGKIYDVYDNSTTDENIFYSAYLKSKVQYNDVDPDKRITIVENTDPPQIQLELATKNEPSTNNI
jgi:hypothetical protein